MSSSARENQNMASYSLEDFDLLKLTLNAAKPNHFEGFMPEGLLL